MRTGSLKRVALMLCALFALAAVLAIGLQLAHAGHHCDDGKCPLCLAYQGSQLAMRALGLMAVARAALLSGQFARRAPLRSANPQPLLSTPVSLGIRMND